MLKPILVLVLNLVELLRSDISWVVLILLIIAGLIKVLRGFVINWGLFSWR